MKAAILKSFGTPLSIETVPDPVLGSGEVIVDVVATGVLAYAHEVFSGKRNYVLHLPVIPGSSSIGRVREVGPDATRLRVGDWVYCDPTVRSRDSSLVPDLLLQGLTALNDAGAQLHRYFHDGSFAERMRLPTENVTRLDGFDPATAPSWCALGQLLVPFGGLLAADLQAGETVVVNGATGAFGGAGVAVALGLGARAVIATGRNQAVLDELARRFGARVRTVAMLGDEEKDRARIVEAADGAIDCVLDLLPPAASIMQVRTALLTVRPSGRVVLMGGVGMGGGAGLELPYPWLMRNSITLRGQFMYPRSAPGRLISMIRAGLIDLNHFAITRFKLDEVNEAVANAASNAGAFKLTTLSP
jgi:alcohol dehydrogenase